MDNEEEDLVLVRLIGRPLFDLGMVIVTPAVRDAVGFQVVYGLLDRHVCGDRGEGPIGDGNRNARFLRHGLRLESHYLLPGGL